MTIITPKEPFEHSFTLLPIPCKMQQMDDYYSSREIMVDETFVPESIKMPYLDEKEPTSPDPVRSIPLRPRYCVQRQCGIFTDTIIGMRSQSGFYTPFSPSCDDDDSRFQTPIRCSSLTDPYSMTPSIPKKVTPSLSFLSDPQ
jgi:hypothetical protein